MFNPDLVTEVNCCNKQHETEEEDGQTQEEVQSCKISQFAAQKNNQTNKKKKLSVFSAS